MRRALRIGTTILLMALAGQAYAQVEGMTEEERLEEAIRLSELGRLHYEGGEFAEAAEAFSRAWDLHPDPILGYNTARSYENAGEPERALEYYEATLGLQFDDDDLRQRCRDGRTRIENLLARVEAERASAPATVEARSIPDGATVTVDGDARGVTPTDISVAPGRYAIGLELDGYERYHEDVELTGGQVLALRVNLVPLAPIGEEDGDTGRRPNWLAVGLTAGAGVGLVVLGALSAVGAEDKFDEAQTPEVLRDDSRFESTRDQGKEFQAASTFFYGLGFAAIVTAAVLYFVTDTTPDDTGSTGETGTAFDVDVLPDGFSTGIRVVW